ncbi:MAG: DUF5683 domain-containing protein [Bacteroidales bacterium]|jgi:hypothetical protein|nr:DUF5683 domain-containing protein [Bacteroidales bacterium]
MKLSVLILFALCFSVRCSYAQQADSLVVETTTADSVTADTNEHQIQTIKVHSPKKAAWMSAVLPGLGQGYNKKYWKIPIIYAGFLGTAYGINHYYIEYKFYRDEYRNRLNEKTDLLKPELANQGNENIRATQLTYQRNMEIFIIVTAVWYLVNILDAVVDAHLMSFDISDDLSLHIIPGIGRNNQFAVARTLPYTANLTFIFNF